MNNADLAERLAGSHDMSKADARRLVDGLLAAIAEAATAGREVALSGFGRFKVTERAARQGRNPSTGETIQIAASRKLAFAPAKQLRDAMNPTDAKADTAKGDTAKAAAKPAGSEAATPAGKAKGAGKPQTATAPKPTQTKV